MRNALRVSRLFAVVALSAYAALTQAPAEKLDAAQWRFSVTFPCQSQSSSQVVKTDGPDTLITMFQCETDNSAYIIAMNDLPGNPTGEKLDGIYSAAVNGEATNTKGVIRTVAPFTLGNVTGRETVIDVPEPKSLIRSRILIVGSRMYQLMCVEMNAQDTSKTGLEFLNSFVLLP